MLDFEFYEPEGGEGTSSEVLDLDIRVEAVTLLQELTENGRWGLLADLSRILGRTRGTISGWKGGDPARYPSHKEAERIIIKLKELDAKGYFNEKRIESGDSMQYSVEENGLVGYVKPCAVTEVITQITSRKADIERKIEQLQAELSELDVTVNTLRKLEGWL